MNIIEYIDDTPENIAKSICNYPNSISHKKNTSKVVLQGSSVDHSIGNIGRNSIGLDQFYTSIESVNKCLEHIDLSVYDCVIEPSAGTGAFSSNIEHKSVIALDIEPKAKGINQSDFLNSNLSFKGEKILVIGNPPFGVHHKLSDAFLLKSFEIPNIQTIAFILPNTYNKHTRQRIIPNDWRIKDIIPLGRDIFIYNEKPYHVPCSFFIFDKSEGKDLRFNLEDNMESKSFYFVNRRDDWDFFVFGANPSKISLDPTEKNRGYYLKARIGVKRLKTIFENIIWMGHSCASGGVAWFSKPEIVKACNDFNKQYT